MCAKVSKKNTRAVEVSHSANRTPPTKTPLRNRGKVSPQQNRSNRKSDHSNVDNQSESESAEEDFLGRPPSHEPSESNPQSQESDDDDEENGDDESDQQSSPQQTTRITAQRSSTDRKSSRKQAKPKRKKHVIREIVALQKSTKLLIARLPFQRYIKHKKENIEKK